MKFKTELDQNKFNLELQSSGLSDVSEFIKSRKTSIKHHVDFRKSQNSKAAWRRNRYKMMKGIKSWHSSTKGKKFHRQLGRFLATRLVEGFELQIDRYELLKAITSVRTHLYIEGEYFRPLDEDVEFELLLEYSLPILKVIEDKIFNRDYSFNHDELELMLRLVDTSEVLETLAESGRIRSSSHEIDIESESTYGVLYQTYGITKNHKGSQILESLIQEESDV